MFGLFKKLLNQIERLINYLENTNCPFSYTILTFIFFLTVKGFLELFVYYHLLGSCILLPTYKNDYLWFPTLALSLILIACVATRDSVMKVAKVILPSFCLIVIAPLVDLFLASIGKVTVPTYFFPGMYKNLLFLFLTFGGPLTKFGMTIRLRIELILALFGAFFYFYIKNRNALRSIFFAFLFYVIVFFLMATPLVVEHIIALLKVSFKIERDPFRTYYLLLLITIMIVPLLYLADKKVFKLILMNLRLSRLMHYESMFFLGVVLSLSAPLTSPEMSGNMFIFTENTLACLIFSPIVIIFCFVYAVIINDIEDLGIDLVSNKDRPLSRGNISLVAYRKLAWFFFFAAVVYSLIVNPMLCFFALLMMGIYFLYSAPPLRFKRIPVFSKLAISLNSVNLVVLGLMVFKRMINPNPEVVILFILFTMAANFIDLKDYEGDKAGGIKTLPTLLGLKKAKLYIGVFFLLNYLMIMKFVKEWYFVLIFAFIGLLQFYLINRNKYEEKYVMYLYIMTVLLFFICLIPLPVH